MSASREELPKGTASAWRRLYEVADIAYSEMAFAVHDLASRRLSERQIDYRSKRLAKTADELRAVLDKVMHESQP